MFYILSFPIFKIIQRVYYPGKFQMFYQKAAVWGRWCLSYVFCGFMHHCASHSSASVLRLVKFWNCQSQNTSKLKNGEIKKNYEKDVQKIRNWLILYHSGVYNFFKKFLGGLCMLIVNVMEKIAK